MASYSLPGIAGITLGRHLHARTADTVTREHDDDSSRYYQAGAAYLARGIEAEAIRTGADVPATLLAAADIMDEGMPQAAARCNISGALANELAPLVEEWLRAAARLHQARTAASSGALYAIYTLCLDRLRRGASPAAVSTWVLELLDQTGGDQ